MNSAIKRVFNEFISNSFKLHLYIKNARKATNKETIEKSAFYRHYQKCLINFFEQTSVFFVNFLSEKQCSFRKMKTPRRQW